METILADLFFYLIPYLEFDDVIPFCSVNKRFYKYGNNYPDRWKPLIDHTYSFIYGYSVSNFNYLTYSYLIRNVDPISRLMIYFLRGNMKVFGKAGTISKQLACYLLKKNNLAYHNSLHRNLFDHLYCVGLSRWDLSKVAREFAKYGNMQGLLDCNENITADQDILIYAREGYFDVLQYTFDPTNKWNVQALENACLYGRLQIVKFLVENNVLISDSAFVNACVKNYIKIVMYLSEKSQHHDEGFKTSCATGNLTIVKFLLPKFSAETIRDGFITACNSGQINILQFLERYVDVPFVKHQMIPILEMFPAESMQSRIRQKDIITYLNSFE